MPLIRRIWTGYVAIGVVLGAIKMVSAVTWAIWYNFAALPTINGHPVSHMGGFFMGLFGAMTSVIAWPIALYLWLSGLIPLTEILFHPWINVGYD